MYNPLIYVHTIDKHIKTNKIVEMFFSSLSPAAFHNFALVFFCHSKLCLSHICCWKIYFFVNLHCLSVWLPVSLPGDLTDAAAGEPEHVLHQPVSGGVEGHQLLLHVLLAALGAQAGGHTAQSSAVVRTGHKRGQD